MSQIFSYFKNFFHPNQNQDNRKRRRTDLSQEAKFPKYRRVSNVFPKKYNQRIDDDIDHFQQVRERRTNYNDILESFLMEQQNQQRKQFLKINDEEFSDEEDLTAIRVPNPASRRSNNTQSSTSGYKFPTNQSVVPSFNFSQQRYQHHSRDLNLQKPSPRPVPDLVPISRVVDPPMFTTNGRNDFESSKSSQQPRGRRSVFDFTKKNRAFNNSSPCFKGSNSILDRNHNLDVKNKYDNLLKMLIPRFAQRSSQQRFSNEVKAKSRDEPITTVDLSSDEAETEINGAGAVRGSSNMQSLTFHARGGQRFAFKKSSAFVDLSDDEDSDPSFIPERIMSSTLNCNKKSEIATPASSQRQSVASSPTLVVPIVKPVNSLKDRQEAKSCLKDDPIAAIVKRFNESRIRSDSLIYDELQNISQLTSETAEQEKKTQRRIDETVSSMKQCIILNEEEEPENEYPPLNDQQLAYVRFGLHGPRGEMIISKFNMSITRHDLNTLDAENWLNDEVINFYMELIKERSEKVEHLPKVHVMNTFFLGKLLTSGHAGVRRWTRKVDIFSVDVIPVPVHVGGVHWCMSIIHMRDKSIKYYDSMGHPNHQVLEALEQYLKDESMDKKKVPFDTSDWTIECVRDCPQQRNGSDCGVFSCMFAEFISRDSKISFHQQHMQYFRRKMILEIATGQMVLGYD